MKTSQIYNFKKYIIHQFSTLDSTNSTAYNLAENQQIFDGEIIWALQQNKGRGRLDREWQSPVGNLYFSLVLQPKIINKSLAEIPQISLVASCALQKTLADLFHQNNISANINNKWPNDLLINNKKVAGILLESKITNNNCEFVILGIGINMVSNPENTIFPATNIKNFIPDIILLKLLENFLENFDNLYENWLNFGNKNIQELWNKNAFKINENIKINIDDKAIEGCFKGIDNEGRAMIYQDNQTHKISYGEVC